MKKYYNPRVHDLTVAAVYFYTDAVEYLFDNCFTRKYLFSIKEIRIKQKYRAMAFLMQPLGTFVPL